MILLEILVKRDDKYSEGWEENTFYCFQRLYDDVWWHFVIITLHYGVKFREPGN